MVRPRLVVLENVDAIAENGLRVALGELAEIGFDAEWEIIPACAMGAPHTRRRMFVVAYPHIGERASGGASGRMGRRMVQTAHANQVDRERNAWPREPSVGRVADGVPNRVDRLRALGNAVVPQVAEYIGRLLSESTDMKEQS
jgi:DNA (cytosine-5)-methyltransferase 1